VFREARRPLGGYSQLVELSEILGLQTKIAVAYDNLAEIHLRAV
jgi:hypothetical protein